jgi:hypothetical protein
MIWDVDLYDLFPPHLVRILIDIESLNDIIKISTLNIDLVILLLPRGYHSRILPPRTAAADASQRSQCGASAQAAGSSRVAAAGDIF